MSEPSSLPNVKKVLAKVKGVYYLQPETEPVPTCEGCFNVGESCGTPCFECERQKAWSKEWSWDLMLDGKYIVWKRKEEKCCGF